MSNDTICCLAGDAGVSTHIVRDYELRGMLKPCGRTDTGYRLYDDQALCRLRLIRLGKEAGVSLIMLEQFCQAFDESAADELHQNVQQIRDLLKSKRVAQNRFEQSLMDHASGQVTAS